MRPLRHRFDGQREATIEPVGDDHRVAARIVQAVVTMVPIGFALYYGNALGLGLVLEVVAVSVVAGFAAAFAYLLIRTDRGSSQFIALFAALALASTGYSAWLITTARDVEQQEANAPDPPQRIHIGSDAAERFGVPVSFVIDVEVRNLDHPPTSTDLTGNGSIATPVAAYYQDGTSLILLVGQDSACPFDTILLGPRSPTGDLPVAVPIGPRTFSAGTSCSEPQTPDIALRITLPDDDPIALRDTGAGGPARQVGPGS